ncbi:MAG: suppressor of fused domain protein [Micromonosporaceae bacterium]
MQPGYDITDSGDRVYRSPDGPRDPAPPDSETDNPRRGLLRGHVERHIGPVQRVWPELFSDVRIDLLMTTPTPRRPYVTLVTAGMSDRAMNVPSEVASTPYAELVLSLPPDWPRTERDWANDANYWPLRTLRQAARMPHRYGTWLDVWHTVPNGEPPAPLAAGVEFVAVLVAPTLLLGPVPPLPVDDAEIVFHSVIPLYAGELALALESGMEELVGRFGEHRVTELLDPTRSDVSA